MKLKEYLIFGLIIIGIVFFFQWRIGVMQDKLQASQAAMYKDLNNNFKQLSDSLAAKSEVIVVAQPGVFDKMFNTALQKQYEAIRNQIPKVIQQEIAKIHVENKTTTINKAYIELKGDSVVYYNDSGVVTKTARVVPINDDSSLLMIVPQEIEITNVTITPDSERPDSLLVYLSAVNITTGDTLKIPKAFTYILEGTKPKKFTFSAKPYIGADYALLNGEVIIKGGFKPIRYHSKFFDANLLGIELSYGIKNTPGITLELINLQLNNIKKKK